ncbi:MAG: hypothetical protein IIC84_00585 [Chloroflexi bacterium]|nr:hypothetical protein [Chloroflexota bacterium]
MWADYTHLNSGAHSGLWVLPMGLAAQLTDRGSWQFAELVTLAHRACEVTTG